MCPIMPDNLSVLYLCVMLAVKRQENAVLPSITWFTSLWAADLGRCDQKVYTNGRHQSFRVSCAVLIALTCRNIDLIRQATSVCHYCSWFVAMPTVTMDGNQAEAKANERKLSAFFAWCFHND